MSRDDATPAPAVPPSGPSLAEFLRDGRAETRLRDLLAFAMATEAGAALPAGGIEALRSKAEADLQAYSFRHLHNQIETIRLQAVQEHLARMPGVLSFSRVVIANLVAFAVLAVLALGASAVDPSWIERLRDLSAQLLAR